MPPPKSRLAERVLRGEAPDKHVMGLLSPSAKDHAGQKDGSPKKRSVPLAPAGSGLAKRAVDAHTTLARRAWFSTQNRNRAICVGLLCLAVTRWIRYETENRARTMVETTFRGAMQALEEHRHNAQELRQQLQVASARSMHIATYQQVIEHRSNAALLDERLPHWIQLAEHRAIGKDFKEHVRVVKEGLRRAVNEDKELQQLMREKYNLGNRAVSSKERELLHELSGIPQPDDESKRPKRLRARTMKGERVVV